MYDVERTAEPPSSVQSTELKGGLNVGHDIHVGGEMTVAGDSTFDKDLRVLGWLYAPNIVNFVHDVTKIAKELDDDVKAWIGRLLLDYDGNIKDWVQGEVGNSNELLTHLVESIANEALVLGSKGDWMIGALYLAASIIVGIFCVWLGKAMVCN